MLSLYQVSLKGSISHEVCRWYHQKFNSVFLICKRLLIVVQIVEYILILYHSLSLINKTHIIILGSIYELIVVGTLAVSKHLFILVNEYVLFMI
jgi:hypothetical protein